MSTYNYPKPNFRGSTEEKLAQAEEFLSELIDNLNHSENGNINVSDYVIEQGTSGVWKYRKWNSGVSECWTTLEKSVGSCTQNPTTGLYVSATQFKQRYPTGLFQSTDNAQCTLEKNKVSGILNTTACGNVYETPTVRVMAISDINNQNARINFYTIGRWK